MTNYYLCWDTETNGIPDWKSPSDAEHQPHIVQIAAKLIDGRNRKIIRQMSCIVKPDGWTIPQECVDVHGITTEYALEVGIPEAEAVQMFMDLQNCHLKPTRMAYNKTFDERIVRIALKRFLPDLSEKFKEQNKESICVMRQAKSYLGAKSVKLVDAYQSIVGEPMEENYQAHDAMGDTDAMIDVFYGMLDSAANVA